jgi:hypothetical protein
MSRDFASTLLHHDLHSIDISNVLTWSPFPKLPPGSIPHLKDLQAYLLGTNGRQMSNVGAPFFRIMHVVLDPLIGRCENLTRLNISTVSNGDEDVHEFRDERYAQMYTSWASFMSSTRSTLQHFSYGHFIVHRRLCGSAYLAHLQRGHVHYSADVLFNAHLLPVILKGEWPNMKRLEIRGVEIFVFADRTVDFRILEDPEAEVLLEEAFVEGRFREKLGGEIEVRVEAEGSRGYEELQDLDYGVPR